MRYYSPYSSRTRPPLWPRFLVVFLALAILGGGGWAFFALRDTNSGLAIPTVKGTAGAASAPSGSAPAGTVAAGGPGTPAASNATVIPPAANGTVPIAANALASP